MLPEPARISITEVVRRMEQGVTKPFLCRAEDGKLYVVKGGGFRDTQTMCREWLAGRLAAAFDLPVPPFAVAEVPAELVDDSAVPGIRELGAGPAFASLWVDQAEDLAPPHLPLVLSGWKPRVLLFDHWVCNGDRTLGDLGGNVNLLWTPRDRALHVIDHNNAFDEPFDAATFWQTHVFRASVAQWADEELRAEVTPRLTDAVAGLDALWDELPEEWLWANADRDIPTDVDRATLRTMLERPFSHPVEFWNPAP